jgi:hypothetical protein
MLGFSHRPSRIPRHRLGSEHSAWMRLYLDENVPVIVASLLSAHKVESHRFAGWEPEPI